MSLWKKKTVPEGDVTIRGGLEGAGMPKSAGGWIRFVRPDGTNALELAPTGEFYVDGRLVETDLQVVSEFKRWFKSLSAEYLLANPDSGDGGKCILYRTIEAPRGAGENLEKSGKKSQSGSWIFPRMNSGRSATNLDPVGGWTWTKPMVRL
jgi:hypothetical protein